MLASRIITASRKSKTLDSLSWERCRKLPRWGFINYREKSVSKNDSSSGVCEFTFYLCDYCVCVCVFDQSCPTLCDPSTVAHQTLLSMGFSRQEYWIGLPFPSPGDLPDPGTEPECPMPPALADGFLTTAVASCKEMSVTFLRNLLSSLADAFNICILLLWGQPHITLWQ